jgi:hypothetical protein
MKGTIAGTAAPLLRWTVPIGEAALALALIAVALLR